MRTIKDNIIYDTNNCIKLHTHDGDPQEILYKTKNGTYFIHTAYNSTSPQHIKLIHENDAIIWLAEHDGIAVAEMEFAEILNEE